MGARSVHIDRFYDACDDLREGYSNKAYKAAWEELNQLPRTDQEKLEGTLDSALRKGGYCKYLLRSESQN